AGGSAASAGADLAYAQNGEWPEKERLAFEKEAIGFYVSGHPLHQYEKELKRYARSCASVQRARRDDSVTVAGIVSQLRERPTKTGKRMAWVTLEDLSGSVELVVFPGKDGSKPMLDGKTGKWARGAARPGYDDFERLLKSDDPLLVTGTVQWSNRDEETPTAEIIVDNVQSLREVREKRARRLEVRAAAELLTDERLLGLAKLAKQHEGATPLAVSVIFPGEAEAVVGATRFKVQPSDDFIQAVDQLFGTKVVDVG
ncbi:MAG TPA: OB-fold nucleic acid binding domain-containing protein, partial [Myxococcaceae bacterium]|nr:OB-fold nucleic acid binding domain-containing protein [Myxococcaceae bacterium]